MESDTNISRKKFLSMIGGVLSVLAFSSVVPSWFSNNATNNYGNSRYGGK